jgi:S-adenosylmethionine-diacylgycerolhomoserine-N-methlytransferase
MTSHVSLGTPSPRLPPLERYYRAHAKIYDATRWGFLFGRTALVRALALRSRPPGRILEVGCGTGHNLITLCHTFPAAQIVGLDLSADMLTVARKKLGPLAGRVTLLRGSYDRPLHPPQPFDVVLFSYALTMMNPGWASAIECAYADGTAGGVVAVVDFHDSPVSLFKAWMRLHHVRMDGHLLPRLDSSFRRCTLELRRAYGGLWRYLLFIGER